MIVCPLVPMIILQRIVYNNSTSEIEEQSIFSIVDEVLIGYENCEFYLVGLIIIMNIKMTTLRQDPNPVYLLQGVHLFLPD